MSTTNKPVILELDGILGQLPNGGIINAGGTSHISFTVNGRGLLFDDWQSTAPGGGSVALSLQDVYDNSPVLGGTTGIKLTTGKDFTISDDTDSSIFFKVDAETGKVTITGDLEIFGSSSVIETVLQDSDHWLISPKLNTTTPLRIEPDAGVTPIVDLVTIRRTFMGTPVFRIDSAGNMISTQNLTISGKINNVDIAVLRSDLDHHLAGDVGYRHQATSIDILPITGLPGAQNVQEALQQLSVKSVSGSGDVRGYEHIQAIESVQWLVTHTLASFRCQTTIYNDLWEVIIPNSIQIVDNNNISIFFSSPVSGRAMIFAF